jgi:hypothetical protein
MSLSVRRWSVAGAFAAAGIAIACGGDMGDVGTGPVASPLSGLSAGATNDSSPVTTPPANATPGSFHGTVMGHSPFPPGTDTLSALPRVVGARLAAYVHVQPSAGDTLGVGAQVASVTTDANGQFQFPTLAGALYIVTITPPAGSTYQGVWVTAVAQAHSADYPWWVVLPMKQ